MYIKINILDFIAIGAIGGLSWWLGTGVATLPTWIGIGAYGVGKLFQYFSKEIE